jgi:hypothetical protein
MAKITRVDLQQNYRDCGIELLRQHDSPTLKDVHHYLCMRNHCPAEHCTQIGGFKTGDSCGHILKVKHLIDRILDIVNE